MPSLGPPLSTHTSGFLRTHQLTELYGWFYTICYTIEWAALKKCGQESPMGIASFTKLFMRLR